MSGLEIIQLSALILLTIALWCFFSWRAGRPIKIDSNLPANIPEASASSVLSCAFDNFVTKDSQIIIPSGDGLYLDRLNATRPRLAKQWKKTLANWSAKGATIDIVITRPSNQAKTFWTRRPPELNAIKVHFIRSSDFTTEVAKIVTALDEFHPTLLIGPEKTGQSPPKNAMWIEWNHPVNSITATNIEYYPPSHIHGEVLERFNKYKEFYTKILNHSYSSTYSSSDRAPASRELSQKALMDADPKAA